MITTIKLFNYRQHKETRLEFVQGVNTIVGANGVGKSTIPEAIEFALYGAKALRDSAKGFISDGEQDGSATVVLQIADGKYQIGRNSKDAKVLKNGEPEASYKSNVTKYVAALTGVNQVGFRLAHYIRQKELATFSMLRPGKRQETIEKMLKIHAVDKTLAKIKLQLDTAKTTYETLLAQAIDTEQENNELADLMLACENSRQHPYEWVEQTELLKTAREDFRTVEVAYTKATEALKVKDKLLLAIESMTAAMSKVGVAEDALKAEVDSLAALGPATDEHYRQLKDQVDALAQLELKAAKMSSLKKELDEVIALVEEPLPLDTKALDAARAQDTAAQNALKAFRTLEGETHCPTCCSKVEAYEGILAQLEQNARDRKALYHYEANAFALLEIDYKKEIQNYRDYIAAVNRRTKLTEQYVEVSFDAEEKQLLSERLQQCQSDRELWQKHEGERKRLEEVLANYAQTATRLTEAETELATLVILEVMPPDNTAILELESEIAELRELETARRESIARLTGRIQELQGIVDRAAKMQEAAITTAAELAQHQARHANFMKFKKYMTAKIRPMLQEVAEALFHRVTKNRFAAFALGSDYDIILTTHRGFIRKLDAISGSENDLANLCLRLAIATLRANRLAGSLGFIILDEISSSFDDKRTKQTLEGLLELRDVIPQIINITHKPVEIKYADRLFTVEETGGMASVTVS